MRISKKVKEFLTKNNISYEIRNGQIYIDGDLDLRYEKLLPDGFNCVVTGYLYLSSLTSMNDVFNPTVGGYLDLRSLTSMNDVFNPTVGGYLDLSSLTSMNDVFNPTVGGYLDLRSLTSMNDVFNPTVGGYLDLRSLTSMNDVFNPTVGGYLYLRSLTSMNDVFNPTVGDSLYLSSNLKKKVKVNKPTENIREKLRKEIEPKLVWQDGKYRKIDGIFCEILSRKGNTLKVKTRNKIAYIFTKDGIYSHGKTVKQAYRDWLFKTSPRDMEAYENLKKDDVKDLNFWVICYRTITGACSFGTENFLEQTQAKIKNKMTLREVIKVTQGQYGSNTFVEFFKQKEYGNEWIK